MLEESRKCAFDLLNVIQGGIFKRVLVGVHSYLGGLGVSLSQQGLHVGAPSYLSLERNSYCF